MEVALNYTRLPNAELIHEGTLTIIDIIVINSALDGPADKWLGCIAHMVMAAYADNILSIPRLSLHGSRQLYADIGNVVLSLALLTVIYRLPLQRAVCAWCSCEQRPFLHQPAAIGCAGRVMH